MMIPAADPRDAGWVSGAAPATGHSVETAVPSVPDALLATPEGMTTDMRGTERTKPLVLGYLRVSGGPGSAEAERLLREMADFAEREGLVLGEVIIDVEATASSGFAALVDALVASHAVAVVLPTIEHFGRLPSVQLAMKYLLEQRTCSQVFVIHSRSEVGP